MTAPPRGPDLPGLAFVQWLGGGGFGDVFLYENLELRRRREAVKIIREGELSEAAVQQLRDEANAMALLEHPNIVAVYETGRTGDGRPFVRMQYYSGGSMEQRAAAGRLPLAEVLRTGIEIGGALESAHRAGILHRDVKPANILVNRYNRTGLTDFGVAAQMGDDRAGEDVGVSVPWAPPEMLYSDTAGSPQSDVYSLAATLWHLLVGRSPFEIPGGDNSRLALMTRVRSLPPPETGRPDCPAALDQLLRQAMAKDPALRPGSVAALTHSLRQVEDELRLPQTTPMVLDLEPGIAPMPTGPTERDAGAGDGAGPGAGTVIRPRQVPDRPARVGRAGGPPAEEPTATARTQMRPRTAQPPPAGDATQRRPKVSEVEIAEGADPVARGTAKGLLVTLGVLLVIAAGAIGWLVVGRGEQGVAAPLATVSDAPPVDEAPPPPGPVTVRAARSGGTVDFTWTYDGALTTDTYRLRFGDGNTSTADQPEASVPAPTSGKVCLSVIVVRADGSNATRDFPPETCG